MSAVRRDKGYTPREQQEIYQRLVDRAGTEHNGKEVITLLGIIREKEVERQAREDLAAARRAAPFRDSAAVIGPQPERSEG